MFSSISRFSQSEVKKLFASVVKKANAKGLIFLASPKSLETSRILVVTSRKCGSAAKRNRIRRRIKAIFFEKQLFSGPLDIIVIVKKEGIESSFKDLQKSLISFSGL